jgi:hypothetical protein
MRVCEPTGRKAAGKPLGAVAFKQCTPRLTALGLYGNFEPTGRKAADPR